MSHADCQAIVPECNWNADAAPTQCLSRPCFCGACENGEFDCVALPNTAAYNVSKCASGVACYDNDGTWSWAASASTCLAKGTCNLRKSDGTAAMSASECAMLGQCVDPKFEEVASQWFLPGGSCLRPYKAWREEECPGGITDYIFPTKIGCLIRNITTKVNCDSWGYQWIDALPSTPAGCALFGYTCYRPIEPGFVRVRHISSPF